VVIVKKFNDEREENGRIVRELIAIECGLAIFCRVATIGLGGGSFCRCLGLLVGIRFFCGRQGCYRA